MTVDIRPATPGTLPPTDRVRKPLQTSLLMEEKTVSESHAVLVHWMGIGDINGAGFVHGGVVMKLCDEVAGIAAIRFSNRRVVTGGVDRMTFMHPIEQNEL